MKQTIFLIFLFLLCTITRSREIDCSTIKSGIFKSVVNIDDTEFITMIYRKKDRQTEEDTARGIKMEFVVKWTSACTYELSKPKLIKGEVPGVSADHLLYVKVTDVKKESYTAEVSSNFFEGKTVLIFSILK